MSLLLMGEASLEMESTIILFMHRKAEWYCEISTLIKKLSSTLLNETFARILILIFLGFELVVTPYYQNIFLTYSSLSKRDQTPLLQTFINYNYSCIRLCACKTVLGAH